MIPNMGHQHAHMLTKSQRTLTQGPSAKGNICRWLNKGNKRTFSTPAILKLKEHTTVINLTTTNLINTLTIYTGLYPI